MTSAEGTNVRKSQKFAVLDGYAKKAENIIQRAGLKRIGLNIRYAGSAERILGVQERKKRRQRVSKILAVPLFWRTAYARTACTVVWEGRRLKPHPILIVWLVC